MLSRKIFDLAKRRGLIWNSFEIYGGLSGFFDYGPSGALIKDNIIELWKDYYVKKEGFFLIDSTNIGSEEVFRASGHLKEFTDYISYCEKCGTPYRADELIKNKVPDFVPGSLEELLSAIQKYEIKCTTCGGSLSTPEKFNLMFSTTIGPGKGKIGYLRPETAQGMFVNFNNLYRYARETVPFGAAMIGKGFRNEIAPRQGLLRLREFNMAEVEVFFNPSDKKWSKFKNIENLKVRFLTNQNQDLVLALKEAVAQNITNSEAITYFIGITYKFLVEVGLDPEKLRFRQHAKSELAHYSMDCWDCEAYTSFGWVEIVGIADRSNYDLTQHIKSSGEALKIVIKYPEPITKKSKQYVPVEKVLGPLFKEKTRAIISEIEHMPVQDNISLVIKLNDEIIEIPEEAYRIEEVEEKITFERIVPHVIEPSYGIDRIFYALLEHSYYEREDSNYRVLRLKPKLAPVKVTVFPLMPKDSLDTKAKEIYEKIIDSNILSYYDDSGSIGRRYARADEIGVPFNITVDYQTPEDDTVTVRERDTTNQKRIKIQNLIKTLNKLILESKSFEDL